MPGPNVRTRQAAAGGRKDRDKYEDNDEEGESEGEEEEYDREEEDERKEYEQKTKPTKKKQDKWIAWLPMGQAKVEPDAEWLEKLESLKADHTVWYEQHRNIMSFEVWCVATCYDPTKADGGPQFQMLMHALLVHTTRRGSNTKTSDLSTTYTADPEWIPGHEHGYKRTDGGKYVVHSPVTQGYHPEEGIPQGAFSNNQQNQGFWFYSEQQSIDKQTGYSTNVPRAPLSKTQFLQSFAVKNNKPTDTAQNTQGHTTEASFMTPGRALKGNPKCIETTSCMSTANLTAAIFGLYYYPGCEEIEYNWTVNQTIDAETTYDIRMRMWNPNYKWVEDEGFLFVQEPLNPNAYYNEAHPEPRVVGGLGFDTPGFAFPDLLLETQEDRYPLTTYKLIRDKYDKTRLAPFFGTEKPQNGIGSNTALHRERCVDFNNVFPNRVHKPTRNEQDPLSTYFGFGLPTALWLYPHFRCDGDTPLDVVASVRHSDTPSTYGDKLILQDYPQWKNTALRAVQGKTKITALHQLFHWPAFADMSDRERRDHAINEWMPALESVTDGETEGEEVTEEETEEEATTTRSTNPDGKVVGLRPAKEVNRPFDGESNQHGTEQDTADNGNADTYADIGVRDNALNAMTQESTLDHEGEHEAELKGEGVESGAKRRNSTAGKRDLNDHWKAGNYQAWPHSDIYERSSIELDVEGVMDPDAIKEYEKMFGSTHNLYLRGENVPHKINGMKPSYGKAKMIGEEGGKVSILDTPIKADSDIHKKNLCRILAIYYWDGPIGISYGTSDQCNNNEKSDTRTCIKKEEKKNGMLGGIWIEKKTGTQTKKHINFGKPKKDTNNFDTLWPPVFEATTAVKKLLDDPEMPDAFSLDKLRGDDGDLSSCITTRDPSLKSKAQQLLDTLTSKMTVREWVTSPWHLSFIPYELHNIVFRDGETYSEGCVSCCRPFFEFEFMYAGYRLSEKGTMHWPTLLWTKSEGEGENKSGGEGEEQKRGRGRPKKRGRPKGRGGRGGQGTPKKFESHAPLPFHHESFWPEPDKQATAVTVMAEDEDGKVFEKKIFSANTETTENEHAKENDVDGVDVDGGWHNWPTYEFNVRGTAENDARTGTRPPKTRYTYRRYLNYVWDEDSNYTAIPQGRLSRSKVQFGMQDYMLMRASKYGNLCQDCAAFLETAPGLLLRNHRAVYERGIVKGNAKTQQERSIKGSAWWNNLMNRMPKGGHLNFDPDALHTTSDVYSKRRSKKQTGESKEAYEKRVKIMRESYASSMDAYANHLKEQHGVELGKNTKHKQPPDIHIQKTLSGTADAEKIAATVKDLRAFLEAKDSDSKSAAWQSIDTNNVALRHMILELERKYTHTTRFEKQKHQKQFDPDVYRHEIRNVVLDKDKYDTLSMTDKIKYANDQLKNPVYEGGDVYHNCLVVRTYDLSKGGISKDKQGNTVTDFKEEQTAYFITRKGAQGEDSEVPVDTMWRGDLYVLDLDNTAQRNGNNDVKQVRRMRQSRLFITYSLHRMITGEEEARHVMETMARAAHELFGNDTLLSELLVFGHKLGNFGRADESSDTISKARFEVIREPNKKDQLENFYGQGAPHPMNSYVYDTYETHIDSVEVDAGVEIGPIRKHPHFHLLLTINHFTYVQIDYFKMNAYLEMMFKGIDPLQKGWGDRFLMTASSGDLFYSDNENPMVDIRVYPQDNWQDIISAYVRKNATPSVMESIRARVGEPPTT